MPRVDRCPVHVSPDVKVRPWVCPQDCEFFVAYFVRAQENFRRARFRASKVSFRSSYKWVREW